MIGQIGSLLCLAGGISALSKKEEKGKELKEAWELSMLGAGLFNKFNGDYEDKQTFELLEVIPKKYGYDAIISIPYGIDPEKLEEIKPVIEANIGCYLYLEWKRFDRCFYARFVTVPFDDTKPFEPVKTKPYEVYISTNMYHKDIIADMRVTPHVLVSGTTGVGKSVLMFMLILNILANRKNNVDIYLAQISDKKDLRFFRNCDGVKYYADELYKTALMYKHLMDVVKQRNSMLNKEYNVNNIYAYNKKYKGKKKQMNYIYVFADEYSFYMPESIDSDRVKALKTYCIYAMSKIAKEARSVGIYIVIGLQRPDKESMPPTFKTLLCTRIAMAQNNTASSLVVIDDGEAVNLENRELIALMGKNRYFAKTLYLDEELLELYVNEYNAENHEMLNLDRYKSFVNKTINRFCKSKKKSNEGIEDDTQEMESAVAEEDSTVIEETSKSESKESNVVNIEEFKGVQKGGIIK